MAETAGTMPHDIEILAKEVIHDLRGVRSEAPMSDLGSGLQVRFGELARHCLAYALDHPEMAADLIKLGPTEQAYGLPTLRMEDAVLRLHYYTQEGSAVVGADAFPNGLVNTSVFGRPHSHMGDIAAAVPVGTLIHHTFSEIPGKDYVTGKFHCSVPGPGLQVAQFAPTREMGLEPDDTKVCNPDKGYWMNGSTVHVVSWPEPTITAVINDLEHPRESRTYIPGDEVVLDEIVQTLDAEERDIAWSAFTKLMEKGL